MPAAEMFPAGDDRFRVERLSLTAGETVRAVECGPPGGAPVVLFPGWAAPAFVFRELLPALGARGYRAIAIELRGHGLSDKPGGRDRYSTEAMAAHAAEAVNALGLEAVVLGGHSLGAAIAARAAPRIRARNRAMVLLSPVGMHGQPRRLLVKLLRNPVVAALAPYVVGRWVVRIVLRMAAARGGIYGSRAIDEYWAPSQFREFAPAMLALLHELDWGDREPVDVADIRVPTLAVYGTGDPLMTRTRTVDELRKTPGVRVVALPGVGHIVTDEAPAAVADAVLSFLDGLAGR